MLNTRRKEHLLRRLRRGAKAAARKACQPVPVPGTCFALFRMCRVSERAKNLPFSVERMQPRPTSVAVGHAANPSSPDGQIWTNLAASVPPTIPSLGIAMKVNHHFRKPGNFCAGAVEDITCASSPPGRDDLQGQQQINEINRSGLLLATESFEKRSLVTHTGSIKREPPVEGFLHRRLCPANLLTTAVSKYRNCWAHPAQWRS